MTGLLWHSNAPFVSTGYGVQTGLFAKRLAQHYDFAISAFYGIEGNVLTWDGISVYPGMGVTYGNETIRPHARKHLGELRDGLVVTLMDVWVLDPNVWGQMNTVCWTPVDHDPAPPPVLGFFQNSGAVPIAMSRFGEEMLGELDPLYVPHAVDTQTYRPFGTRESRDKTKIPQDAFVVGVVAANKGGSPTRKCFEEAISAFKVFRERHDDAVLYLHTAVAPEGGMDIPALIRSSDLPFESVVFADQDRVLLHPFNSPTMARVFSSIDVLLSASAGEGFGIPVLEAQSCGKPAIVTDFSAMREVCGAGWKVDCTPSWTALGSWQVRPKVESIVAALEECYAQSEDEREAMSEKARNHALTYDVERVMEDHMLPALREAEERFEMRKPIAVAA